MVRRRFDDRLAWSILTSMLCRAPQIDYTKIYDSMIRVAVAQDLQNSYFDVVRRKYGECLESCA